MSHPEYLPHVWRSGTWPLRAVLATVMGATLALSGLVLAPAQAAQVTYTVSTATFPNPERGLYRQPNCRVPLDGPFLNTWRNKHVTLALCVFYLGAFKETAISPTYLTFLQQQTDVVRAAKLKLIVRFAYTESTAGDDAPLARVLGHIDQLKPYFTANSDVIDVVQSGFVGAWGEGAYSQNFTTNGVITDADWTERKAVVTRLLGAVPASRMVQVRTPTMKQKMYGTTALSPAAAYTGSGAARVGHHNDCFLASSDDKDTYENPALEYPYLAAETRYVAMGGETCSLNPPRSDCPTALSEMALFHYSYLNRDRVEAVNQTWRDGGCMTPIEQRLGYRFNLVASLFPASVARGGTYLAQIFIKNTGFATPHNARPVYLVMRNTATGSQTRVKLSTDPRRWAPGATTAITQNVGVLSTMKPGTYELLLSLPDPAPALATKPEYAIQMANTNVWDGSGLNKLLTSITVT